ncbi:hypothetical protein EYF80_043018 [Liparis tanakae]|uniref:Uncharacterized protein n=1 Tax=Liparis tanakae TaxID=230148 RepID=A0A4Z2FZY0_9TELE|nr:hypothetical protein EYF80_043018 [Liparis tanakae]
MSRKVASRDAFCQGGKEERRGVGPEGLFLAFSPRGYLLIRGPHLIHDLGQVLSFRSIDIHTDANLGDLGLQLSNILLMGKYSGSDFLDSVRGSSGATMLSNHSLVSVVGQPVVQVLHGGLLVGDAHGSGGRGQVVVPAAEAAADQRAVARGNPDPAAARPSADTMSVGPGVNAANLGREGCCGVFGKGLVKDTTLPSTTVCVTVITLVFTVFWCSRASWSLHGQKHGEGKRSARHTDSKASGWTALHSWTYVKSSSPSSSRLYVAISASSFILRLSRLWYSCVCCWMLLRSCVSSASSPRRMVLSASISML